jgi:hypothetical protein
MRTWSKVDWPGFHISSGAPAQVPSSERQTFPSCIVVKKRQWSAAELARDRRGARALRAPTERVGTHGVKVRIKSYLSIAGSLEPNLRRDLGVLW